MISKDVLTPVEKKIVILTGEGRSQKVIAAELGIGMTRMEERIREIKSKTKCGPALANMVMWGVRSGLIPV